ncbi:MAG TPA: sugar-binding domain-containing protein [Chthonomonadales bacterium]|nr:sugar-binding domain-containing protein [Chthonomonadales bacterium]
MRSSSTSSTDPGPRGGSHLLEALHVAYCHCVLRMPLRAIAEMLGKSPATITRRLDEVRRAGWLHDRPEFAPPPDLWKTLRAHIACGDTERVLQEALAVHGVGRLTVAPSVRREGGAKARAVSPESVERVGLVAAHRLGEALANGDHVVGVNWGWSVRHCVANLRPPCPNPNLRFVPLVGSLSLDENDPHFEEAIECSSNRLAQLAASAFRAPRVPRLNTPAYVPRRFHADAYGLSAIRDFIESDVSHRRVFGGRDERGEWSAGLIERMDTLITGLTSLDVQTLPAYRPGLITTEDLPALQRAGVVGDLALHLLVDGDHRRPETEEAAGSDEGLVAAINDLIVGASPADFVRVAERARSGEREGLGVVVLAAGPWKARILATAMKLRAVNELITDFDTARALCDHLGLRHTAAVPEPA